MNTQLGLRSDGGFPRFSSQQTPGRIPSKRPRSRLQEEEDSLWLPPSSCSSSPLSSSSRNSTGYEKGPAPKKLQHTSTTAETGVAQGVYGNLPLTADSLSLGSGGFRDYGAELQMKSDHTHRPLWVCKDGCILLEMFSVASRQANELLLTIAEPICRGDFVHEFQITIFSLYAGISIGLTCDDMLHNLEKFSKNYIPEDLVEQIQKVASAFGKVKLVLNESKYYIESAEKKELDYLLSNPLIRSSAVSHHSPLSQNQLALMTNSGTSISGHLTSNILSTTSSSSPSPRGGGGSLSKGAAPSEVTNESLYVIANAPTLDASQLAFPVTEKEDDHGEKESSGKGDRGEGSGEAKKGTDGEATSGEGDSQKSHQNKKGDRDQAGTGAAAKKAIVPARQVFSFQVSSDRVEEVKRLSVECMHRPLLNEYDFRRDKANKNLSSLLLKPTTKIRYYQERALRKMFSNGRARSGIIVLPCGAGKTLTGITAACTLRKSVMILTTSAVAVDQWRKQFEEYTTIDCSRLLTLTAETKQNLWPLDEAGVLVSTYTMLAFSGRRSAAAERIMQQVKEREWGLLIFDEVQFAPAPAFRRINDLVKSHCRLGLTATLVREDDLIKDLQWLIGPKLFEANWIELQNQGFLARVSCQEVWCPMTAEFYREYLRCTHAKQRKLWVCNPTKLMTCEWLLRYHEARGDKVLVFSDNVFALLHTAKALNRPFIYGQVSAVERVAILNKFKNESTFNSLFLSKVGDNAIDIPCANVVIQISFNFASRRQEAQRLGRILRAKPQSADEGENFNAFFYSLISKDTLEMVYADKRQQFIIDQGYSYKVIHSKDLPMQPENLIYGDLQRQREILADILASDDNDRSLDDDEDDTSTSRALMNAGANPLAGPSLWSTAGSGEGGGNVFGRMPYGGHVQQLHGGLARLAGDDSVPAAVSRPSGGSRGGGGRGGGRSGVDTKAMHPFFRGFHGKK